MNKHKKHVASTYVCRLLCADDKISRTFRLYLGKEAV